MMQPFPKEFLEQVATEKYLTDEQREAFIETYCDANNVSASVANRLHISENAFRVRLTGVYKAFEIDGKGSNKKQRLHTELLEMYRQQQGRDSDDPILDRGIDDFVERVRQQVEPDITQRCGTMRVLDMAQPVGLGEIYTDVNILAKVSRTSRKDLAQIQEMVGLDLENFERFSFGEIAKERVAGLEVVKEHRKLMIWGKPGAGKTTFLKHLAMSCIRGELFPELVPFFVTLKSFAEEEGQPNLFTYLQAQAEMHGVEPERLKEIINAGRAMILLDGLDEVRHEDSQRVIKEIQNFADLWQDNFFAITCRIAAEEYTFQGGFIEIEVADFNQEQIACFVTNWFSYKCEEKKSKEFLDGLENQETIQELASSPLLLTLLCLVFEENFQFPQNRAELYKDGLDILLKKWDGKRAIQRNEIYKKLTLKRREDLLSEIAFQTFIKGDYFFSQRKIEDLIFQFIQNLPSIKDEIEASLTDSEFVLKSIESQHGLLVERAKRIYSFSHLTFQEYLTAQYIAKRSRLYNLIVQNLAYKRWQEVLSLVFYEISDRDSASQLAVCVKNKLDKNIAADEKIQDFLTWLNKKTKSLNIDYLEDDYIQVSEILKTPFSLREPLSLSRSLYFALLFSSDLYLELSPYLDFSLDLHFDFSLSLYLNLSISLFLDQAIEDAKEICLVGAEKFQNLRKKLPSVNNSEYLENWWENNGKYWKKQLRQAMIQYRNIGHEWQWTEEQQTNLDNYWNANRFLLECLQSAYIRRDVREWIENTMFLPMSELEKMPPPEL